MAFTISGGDISWANSKGVVIKVNGLAIEPNHEVVNGDVVTVEAKTFYTITSPPSFDGAYNPITETFERWVLTLESGTLATGVYSGQVSGSPSFDVTTNYNPTGIIIDGEMLANVVSGGATLYINDIEANEDDVLETGDIAKLTANAGLQFYWENESEGKSSAYFQSYNPVTEQVVRLYFTLESSKVATLEYDGSLNNAQGLSLQVFTEVEEIEAGAEPTNNVYLVDNEIIEQVSVQRFTESLDYGVYILSLLKLPFEVDAELITDPTSIKLGAVSLNVSAPQLRTDILKIDLGEISVAESESNALDYDGVVTVLHLPFTTPITVDARQVINETLKIEYLINLYDGSCTVNLFSTKVGGEVFYSDNFILGVEVPYKTEGMGLELHNNLQRPIGENYIRTPFIEVIKHDAVLPYGFFTIPVVDEGMLGNATGYVEVENVALQGGMFSREEMEIKTMLSNGVIINE